MMNKKKAIPLLIIVMLLINVLLPTVYKGFISYAEDADGSFNVEVDSSDISNIKIKAGGNFSSKITSIKYTDGGKIEKDEVVDYFNDSKNNIVDITKQNQGVTENVLAITIEKAVQGKEYTILVVFEDGSAYIGYASIGKRESGTSEISYDYSSPTLTIKVVNDTNNIVLVKIAKASEILQDSDFETKGEELPITVSKNVTTTYTIKEECAYKIYAKDSEGHYSIKETNKLAITSNKEINIYHKKDDNNAIIIKAKDSAHKIVKMKVMVSEGEVSLEEIKNSGTDIKITEGTEVEGEYTISGEHKYITVYIEDEYGANHKYGKTISSIPLSSHLDFNFILNS